MSVKFIQGTVQSSDNKYVQARFLLSGSFTDSQFANEDNWYNEHVEVSTQNTENNAASIKVNDKTYNIKDEGVRYLGNPLDWLQNQYIDEGVWKLSSSYESIIVPIKGAKSIQWTTGGHTYYTLLSDYTTPENGDTPSFATDYSDRVSHSGTTHSIGTISSNAKYLYIFCYDGSPSNQYFPTSIKVNDIELLDNTWLTNAVFNNKFSIDNIYNIKADIDKVGCIYLPYTTDVATTRKFIPSSNRKRGLTIAYFDGEKIVKEIFNYNVFSDGAWANNDYWMQDVSVTEEPYNAIAIFKQMGIEPLVVSWQKGYLKADGSFAFTNPCRVSNYIAVSPSETLYISAGADSSSTAAIVEYDSSFNIVRVIPPTSGRFYDGSYSVPATGVSYIRINRHYTKQAGVWRKMTKNTAFYNAYIKDEDIAIINSNISDIIASRVNMYLPYTTDKATTRLLVPSELRRKGLSISYVVNNELVIETYAYHSLNDANWGYDANWNQVWGYKQENESILATLYQNGMMSLAIEWPISAYFNADGTYTTSSGFRISNYIPVSAGEKYQIVSIADTASKAAIVCYDSAFNIISYELPNETTTGNKYYKGDYTIPSTPSGIAYIRICKRYLNEEKHIYCGVWKSIPMQEIHPEILKKFSDVNGSLYYNGNPIATETSISTLVTDLPISDGTGIEDGYAYIDSSTYVIKVKHS